MTDKKTRIVSNLLSLVLGAGIGAGVYAIKEQKRFRICVSVGKSRVSSRT